MSRIGKLPVTVPAGVDVTIDGTTVTAKGAKGELTRTFPEIMIIKREGDDIIVERPNDSREAKAYHGLVRTLIANMVEGVSAGFSKKLQLVGVGYRAALKGKDLEMQLGFSHPVLVEAPENITFEVPSQTEIIVSGPSKEQVGQVAANIRKWRKPEPYKGKGIRYEGEHVRRKAGKAEPRTIEIEGIIMNKLQKKQAALARRHRRVRGKIAGTAARPRVCVTRSNSNMYVQVIDDVAGKTICGVSTLGPDFKATGKSGATVEGAAALGAIVGKKAQESGVTEVVFDRGGNLYHGRIKALADAAREAGLKF